MGQRQALLTPKAQLDASRIRAAESPHAAHGLRASGSEKVITRRPGDVAP